MFVAFGVVVIPLVIIIYRSINLYRNYEVARNLGIPTFISPVSWQDPWWMVIQPLFLPFKNLPFGWGEWVTYSMLGWALEHRYSRHEKVGPIFATVSPRKTEFVIADPAAATEVLSQWKVWTKSQDMYKLFNVFGKNVNTVVESEWPRHRKIVSNGFKESNMKVVWDMSIRQAAGLARNWELKSKTTGEISCAALIADMGTFSLHVLAAALWGEEHEFEDGLGNSQPPPGHKMSYKDALKGIMDQILLIALFDAIVLPSWLMPSSLGKAKLAATEYRQFLQEKVNTEKAHLYVGGDERANLSAILVNANENAKIEEAKIGKTTGGYLTDEELYGNFFILNMAGHETTASTVSYALALLGSHAEVQHWVREEVDANFDTSKPYSEVYTHMTRVISVMYETVRIYGAIQNLNKYSRDNHDGQPLTVAGKTYMIPPSSYVSVNFQALHTSPWLWGEDSLDWKPQRWIASNASDVGDSSGDMHANTFGERLGGPPEGAIFVGWTLGQRDCPGRKFSKVEFVAVLAYILKKYEIKPAMRFGETEDMAAKRLYQVVHDSTAVVMPRIRRPEDAGVALKAR